MRRVLGIDPGMNGGAAIIDGTANSLRLVDVIDIPTIPDGERREIDAWALMCWCLGHEVSEAIVENVQPMPSRPDEDGGERRGMGAVSAFRFGAGVYGIRAAVRCAKIEISTVAPQSWKRHFGLKGPDKEQSRQLALRFWPDQAGFFSRKKDHQRAEAALIARFHIERRNGITRPAPQARLFEDTRPF